MLLLSKAKERTVEGVVHNFQRHPCAYFGAATLTLVTLVLLLSVSLAGQTLCMLLGCLPRALSCTGPWTTVLPSIIVPSSQT